MARLLDQRTAINLLKAEGWTPTVGGNHVVKMVREGDRPITLPRHRGQVYGKALTHAIARQAGLTAKENGWTSPSKHMRREMATGPRSGSCRDALPPPER